MAYDPDTVDPKYSNKSNIIVFNLQPLNGNIKSKILHISAKEKSGYDNETK